ncbi:MAG: hypothetical protein ACREMD_15140 [Gemmatimonadota bacterium]
MGDLGRRLRIHLGRRPHAGDDRHAEGRPEARDRVGSAGALIRIGATLFLSGWLHAFAGVAAAQGGGEASPSGLEATAAIAALHTDRDLAARHDPVWTPVVEGRIAWRVTPLVAIGIGAWVGAVDAAADTLDDKPPESRSLRGVGLALDLAPLADRGIGTQPVLRFGIESVAVDDRLDRGPAFLFGAGLEHGLGRSWAIAGRVENRFLTIERESVDGVATSRDVALWSVGVSLAWGAGRS